MKKKLSLQSDVQENCRVLQCPTCAQKGIRDTAQLVAHYNGFKEDESLDAIYTLYVCNNCGLVIKLDALNEVQIRVTKNNELTHYGEGLTFKEIDPKTDGPFPYFDTYFKP